MLRGSKKYCSLKISLENIIGINYINYNNNTKKTQIFFVEFFYVHINIPFMVVFNQLIIKNHAIQTRSMRITINK